MRARLRADVGVITSRRGDMLSPHEFAALLLIEHVTDPSDFDRGDLKTLVERQFVALERLTSGYRRARLTERGRSILETIDRRY
jgi:hypothetical protein